MSSPIDPDPFFAMDRDGVGGQGRRCSLLICVSLFEKHCCNKWSNVATGTPTPKLKCPNGGRLKRIPTGPGPDVQGEVLVCGTILTGSSRMSLTVASNWLSQVGQLFRKGTSDANSGPANIKNIVGERERETASAYRGVWGWDKANTP